jgi:Tfp pilus assembly protein PilF
MADIRNHSSMKPRLQTSPKIRLRRVILLVLVSIVALGLGCQLWAYWEYRAGERANARHDFAEAQKHFERCLQVWFLSSDTHISAARAARRAGNLKEAETHLLESGATAGRNDKLDLELKLLHVQQGESVDQELVSLLDQNHPDSVVILEVLTPAYLEAYQLSSALECIRRWVEREPGSLAAWHYRAQVYDRLQMSTELLASYRRILELDPGNDDVRLQYARQLNQVRQYEEALEQYQNLRSRLGDTPAVLSGIASCLGVLNQPEEARRLLEQVLAQEPHNGLALAERGRLALEYDSPAEAERWLRRAAAESPTERTVLYNLFQCLQRTGRQEEAAQIKAKFTALDADLAQLREAIQQVVKNPHDPEPRYQAGMILLRNGKEPYGLRWLASALVEDPRHAATHRALADYYERSGDRRRAAQHREMGP